MGYLRNILFLFCCWSVASSLFAASVSFLQKDCLTYIDPKLPKVQSSFNQEANDNLDVQSSFASSSPAAVFESLSLKLIINCSYLRYNHSKHRIKKSYLFTYSGISPPFAIS